MPHTRYLIDSRLHTSRMSLSEDVDLEEFVTAKDDLSGADIKAVCTEAGLLALRERRMRVTKVDFSSAREKVCMSIGPVWLVLKCTWLVGVVQEERRHTGRSLPMIILYHLLVCLFKSVIWTSHGAVGSMKMNRCSLDEAVNSEIEREVLKTESRVFPLLLQILCEVRSSVGSIEWSACYAYRVTNPPTISS